MLSHFALVGPMRIAYGQLQNCEISHLHLASSAGTSAKMIFRSGPTHAAASHEGFVGDALTSPSMLHCALLHREVAFHCNGEYNCRRGFASSIALEFHVVLEQL